MTDLIAITNLALSIASKTTEALNALRERAQRSTDIDIKDQINTLYDNVLQLKEVMSRLLDNNKELSRQLAERQHPPERRQVGEAIYYYDGEDGPFCQACYDTKLARVALQPEQHEPRGSIIRKCTVCNNTFYEKKVPEPVKVNFGGQWR